MPLRNTYAKRSAFVRPSSVAGCVGWRSLGGAFLLFGKGPVHRAIRGLAEFQFRYKSVKKKQKLRKPLIGKSNSATARTFAHLRPSPRCLSGAFLLLPRAFRASSACLPPSARSRVALPLALRVSVHPLTPPSHAPTRNAPFQRVLPQLPCVLLQLPRLFALSRVAT